MFQPVLCMLDCRGKGATSYQCAPAAKKLAAASRGALMDAWLGEGGEWLAPFTWHLLVYICPPSPSTGKRRTNQSKLSGGLPGWSGLEHLLMRRGWGTGTASAWGRGGFREAWQQIPSTHRAGEHGWWDGRAGLFMVGGWGTSGKSRSKMFRLGIRKHFLTLGTVKGWIRLPRKVVQSLSLQVFKTWLDKALNKLLWAHSWACCEQKVGLRPPQLPSSLGDAMILSGGTGNPWKVGIKWN